MSLADVASRRVSVVIPVYCRQRSLDLAIKSLEAEERYILEVIIVDDASPSPVAANAPDILRDRVRLERMAVNGGSSRARQRGVDLAVGDFIAFLDSDDIWLPGKLSAQLAYFDKPSALLAVATGWQAVSASEAKTWCRIPRAATQVEDFASGCWFSPGSTVMVRRTAFDQVGPFDAALRRLEDLDWFLRFARLGGRLEVTPMIGAMIRREGSRGRAIVDQAASHIEAKFVREFGKPSEPLRKLRAWLDVERAYAAYGAGDYLPAASLMARSLWRAPRFRIQLQQWWDETGALIPFDVAKRMLAWTD